MRVTRFVGVFVLVLALIAAGCTANRQNRPAGTPTSSTSGSTTGSAANEPAPPPPPPPPPPTQAAPAPPPAADREPPLAKGDNPSASPTPPPNRSPASESSGSSASGSSGRTRPAAPLVKSAQRPAVSTPAPAADDGFAAIDAFVARMKSAAAALRAEPSRLELGQHIDVRLTVSPGSSVAELRKRQQASGATVEAGAARIAPRMRAQLTVPSGATVEVVGTDGEDRAVRDDADTEWRWTVTPATTGDLPIHARLTAPVVVDGKESAYDVRTFDASVTVFVTPATRAKDFVANNWQWLWATLIVPAWAWWRKRQTSSSKGDAAHT